jgi:glycosyltransferase involved in cell wall biosynthesis
MTRTVAIHQFHQSSSFGDAVTQSLLLTRELLRALGFESEIFVAQRDPRLGDELRDYREYPASSANVLLVHHSIGHDLIEWVLGLPDRKVLVYHNITPPEFFPDDQWFRSYVELGRAQLRQYRPATLAAFCDSQFNADELTALGYDAVTVLPLLLVTDELCDAPWNRNLVEANADVVTLLFVGRLERNKCQHELIDVFRLVHRWLGRSTQCVLVGNYNPCTAYVHELRQKAAALGLADRINLAGHVSREDLYAWYRTANVFVCLSEHEGFGVPLLEAMTFGVPVIAHRSSSVPSTLGGAGILVDGKPLPEIAALVCRLADDEALRRRVVERQLARAAAFSRTRLRGQLATALIGLGFDPPVRQRAPEPEQQEGEACSASMILRSVPRS